MKNLFKPSGSIGEKLWNSVDKKIWEIIGDLVTIQQFDQIKDKIRNQVRDEVSIQAWQEVKKNVKLC